MAAVRRAPAARGAASESAADRPPHPPSGAECTVAPGAQLLRGHPRDDAYTRLATLGPTDPGVLQRHYADRWQQLTPYEKCLFWWTEVHQFALELPRRVAWVPCLRIKSEEMLSGDRPVLERLLGFMDLPWDDRWAQRVRRRVDRWHHHTADEVDPCEVLQHRATVQVAEALGYDAGRFDLDALKTRYVGEPDPGLDRFTRR